MLAALLISIQCAGESPSKRIDATVSDKGHIIQIHGTVLAPCALTLEGNYDRLIRLMDKPDDHPISVIEIPPIPKPQERRFSSNKTAPLNPVNADGQMMRSGLANNFQHKQKR